MKTILLTVKEFVLLTEVRKSIGFASQTVLDFIKNNDGLVKDTEMQLSEEDIYDMVDSLQAYMEELEDGEPDETTLLAFMEKLNATIPEAVNYQSEPEPEGGYVNQDWF